MNGVVGKSANVARAACLLALCLLAAGCPPAPRMLAPEERHTIDRAQVEYPAGYELERYVVNLTAATAFTFDGDGNLIVVEGGVGGKDVRILGFRPDRTSFQIYPPAKVINLPFIPRSGLKVYGPIGGLLYHDGWLYVSHRDANDFGVITRINEKGEHQTVTAGWPAQGEHGITDMAIDPRSGRLFFGMGTATNSGVVGLDDFAIGWPRDYPKVHDIVWKNLVLRGRRMDTSNPFASPLFGIGEIAVSAPFQPFGVSNQTRIEGVISRPQGVPKFNGGIFSIPPTGGELRVEAHGIRYPRGLAFNEYNQLYFTNDGMELRGSRPVKDDPDALLRMVPGTWYGWPDFTADLLPVDPDALRRIPGYDPERFQPPLVMVRKTGYPDVSFVIDHGASNLVAPSRDLLLQGAFPSQSGAAGVEFVPSNGTASTSFKEYVGSAIVALSGDRTPFATGGMKVGPIGSKVMRVDVVSNQVREFIRNTQGRPGSQIGDDPDLLERPTQVRFGPDGCLYVLDFGQMRVKEGKEDVTQTTGKIYRLKPSIVPATVPAGRAAGPETRAGQ